MEAGRFIYELQSIWLQFSHLSISDQDFAPGSLFSFIIFGEKSEPECNDLIYI